MNYKEKSHKITSNTLNRNIRCKECSKLCRTGIATGECLECLDWKMSELRK